MKERKSFLWMENSLEADVRIKWSSLCYKLLGRGAEVGEGERKKEEGEVNGSRK